jgi:hypothetical protein
MRTVWTALIASVVSGLVGAQDAAAAIRCDASMLRGAYGYLVQGTRPTRPPAAPGIEAFFNVAIRIYDGEGQFTQVSNPKGAVSGPEGVNIENSGTYQVNEDCTGTHTAVTPTGSTLVDRFVIVDKGREVRIAVTNPPPIMFTGTLVRIAHGRGRGHEQRSCSDRTLRGTYGIQMQGTRPSAPGGPIEAVIGVAIRTYDGHGGFTQVDNVKGSISGIVFDRPGFGTYEVAADCTAVVQLQPGPGILIEERMVIVDGAEQILSGTLAPAPVMVTALHQRIR